jgi:hypothetical protein
MHVAALPSKSGLMSASRCSTDEFLNGFRSLEHGVQGIWLFCPGPDARPLSAKFQLTLGQFPVFSQVIAVAFITPAASIVPPICSRLPHQRDARFCNNAPQTTPHLLLSCVIPAGCAAGLDGLPCLPRCRGAGAIGYPSCFLCRVDHEPLHVA